MNHSGHTPCGECCKTPMTLRELQATVHDWISATPVGYFPPLTNMAILAEEVGEVARVIARTDGAQKPKQGETLNLADELADVIWVVTALANQHGIDLTEAIGRNVAKKTRRDAHRWDADDDPQSSGKNN